MFSISLMPVRHHPPDSPCPIRNDNMPSETCFRSLPSQISKETSHLSTTTGMVAKCFRLLRAPKLTSLLKAKVLSPRPMCLSTADDTSSRFGSSSADHQSLAFYLLNDRLPANIESSVWGVSDVLVGCASSRRHTIRSRFCSLYSPLRYTETIHV